MQICDNGLCTGCGACVCICPQNCISVVNDEDGFLVAEVDSQRCIECGMCKRHCPQNYSIFLERNDIPDVYAAYSRNDEQILNSASGGIFPVLAEKIIEKGGYVYGCQFSDDFKAVFSCAGNKDELKKMQGSKYVQSHTGKIFKDVKEKLEKGKNVLFSGLPCQVAGLYSYLGQDYSNLYTIDLFCAGTPSEKILQEYIIVCEKKYHSKMIYLNFREKVQKWGPMNYGTKVCMRYKSGRETDSWMREEIYGVLFMSGLSLSHCCLACRFCGFPRVADISLGDFLGLGVLKRTDFYQEKGISAVLLNSSKGVTLYSENSKKFVSEKRTLDEVCKMNPAVWYSAKAIRQRKQFLEDVRERGLEFSINKYIMDLKSVTVRRIKKCIILVLGEKGTMWAMNKRRELKKLYPEKWPQNPYIYRVKRK